MPLEIEERLLRHEQVGFAELMIYCAQVGEADETMVRHWLGEEDLETALGIIRRGEFANADPRLTAEMEEYERQQEAALAAR